MMQSCLCTAQMRCDVSFGTISVRYVKLYLTPYSPTYIPPFTLSGEYYSIFTTYIHYLYSPLIHHGYGSGLSIVYMNFNL